MMAWQYRWQTRDPFEVYARIEAQAQHETQKALRNTGSKMTRDQSDQIEDLLLGWYYWAKAAREFLGYSKISPMFRDTKPELGDVHSDGDEADLRINTYNSEIVDACLDEIPIMMRAAVGVHTRNIAAGSSVHRHPRIAIEQQHAIYQNAKEHLCPMLIKKGLVSR